MICAAAKGMSSNGNVMKANSTAHSLKGSPRPWSRLPSCVSDPYEESVSSWDDNVEDEEVYPAIDVDEVDAYPLF
jgi:hypothetical protein